jgi:hypothetical protein
MVPRGLRMRVILLEDIEWEVWRDDEVSYEGLVIIDRNVAWLVELNYSFCGLNSNCCANYCSVRP